jgi:hypothetical protein
MLGGALISTYGLFQPWVGLIVTLRKPYGLDDIEFGSSVLVFEDARAIAVGVAAVVALGAAAAAVLDPHFRRRTTAILATASATAIVLLGVVTLSRLQEEKDTILEVFGLIGFEDLVAVGEPRGPLTMTIGSSLVVLAGLAELLIIGLRRGPSTQSRDEPSSPKEPLPNRSASAAVVVGVIGVGFLLLLFLARLVLASVEGSLQDALYNVLVGILGAELALFGLWNAASGGKGRRRARTGLVLASSSTILALLISL